ncbi:MAG TPA: DUF4180 domain-containing protein [Myxococcota bacterium]|nr:DUF4180 domain-containing protein [Myxococcota bacterium]
MSGSLHELGGQRVYLADDGGPPLRSDRDALALVSDSYAHSPDWIALPIARCGDPFFQLRTRILGDVAQKLVNYGLRLAIVGDVSQLVSASAALRDFVREANRGRQIWFVASLAELRERLESAG